MITVIENLITSFLFGRFKRRNIHSLPDEIWLKEKINRQNQKILEKSNIIKLWHDGVKNLNAVPPDSFSHQMWYDSNKMSWNLIINTDMSFVSGIEYSWI
jgi:hypothetical protein